MLDESCQCTRRVAKRGVEFEKFNYFVAVALKGWENGVLSTEHLNYVINLIIVEDVQTLLKKKSYTKFMSRLA